MTIKLWKIFIHKPPKIISQFGKCMFGASAGSSRHQQERGGREQSEGGCLVSWLPPCRVILGWPGPSIKAKFLSGSPLQTPTLMGAGTCSLFASWGIRWSGQTVHPEGCSILTGSLHLVHMAINCPFIHLSVNYPVECAIYANISYKT